MNLVVVMHDAGNYSKRSFEHGDIQIYWINRTQFKLLHFVFIILFIIKIVYILYGYFYLFLVEVLVCYIVFLFIFTMYAIIKKVHGL